MHHWNDACLASSRVLVGASGQRSQPLALACARSTVAQAHFGYWTHTTPTPTPKPTSATRPVLLPRPRPRPSPTPSPSPSPRTPPRAPRCAPTHSGEASLFPHFIKTWLAHTHTLPVLRASVVGLGLLRCCAGGTNTVSKISLVLKRRGGVRVASEYAQMATDIYKHHEAYCHRK